MNTIKNIRTSACRVRGLAVLVIGGVMAFAATSRVALADDMPDPLHGVCIPACVDNGTNSPTTSNPTTFGFTVSPGPASGSNLLLVFLVPTSGVIPGSISFTGASSGTAARVPGTWSSGDLASFLGISASPANPIGAFAAGGSAFDVFTANLGPETLPGPSDPLSSPYWTTAAPGIPIDSYILGFFNEGTAANPNWIATANSGAIFVDGPPGNVVPEPSSLFLLGTGVLGAAGAIRRRYTRRA